MRRVVMDRRVILVLPVDVDNPYLLVVYIDIHIDRDRDRDTGGVKHALRTLCHGSIGLQFLPTNLLALLLRYN